jgi:sigma-E factor negative regulatory protein RseB
VIRRLWCSVCLLSLLFAGELLAQNNVAQSKKPGWLGQAKAWVSDKFKDDKAINWLQRSGPALREQNYQGTLVMVAEGRIETMAVYHRFDEGRERERIVALSGPPREVVRDNKMVVSSSPKDGTMGYDANESSRWNTSEKFAAVEKLDGYEAKLGNVERIANYEAQVVEIFAKDKWRYGYRLWLEKQSAFPLRIDLIDEKGNILEKVAFTDMQLGKVPKDDDLAFPKGKNFHRIQSITAGSQNDPGWRVKSPPEGFDLRAARNSGSGVQLLYSDGLAFVSVYIEPVAANQKGETAMQRGAVNAFSQWDAGRRITVIGKVPAMTVAQFAEVKAKLK